VIVEKAGRSDVPDIDKKKLAPCSFIFCSVSYVLTNLSCRTMISYFKELLLDIS